MSGFDPTHLGLGNRRGIVSLLEWCAVLVGLGVVLIIWQLASIGAKLGRSTALLESLDAEVFRVAQEQNPSYGVCSSCGRRAIVRYVVPRDREPDPAEPELFYCQSCWWMSSSVRVSDENKRYKDRLTSRDRLAASVGPGAA